MRRPRPPHVVIAAWIVSGPLGHLYAGVLDLVEALGRYAWERASARIEARARPQARARARARAKRP